MKICLAHIFFCFIVFCLSAGATASAAIPPAANARLTKAKSIVDCNTINWATWGGVANGTTIQGEIAAPVGKVQVTMSSYFSGASEIFSRRNFDNSPYPAPTGAVPETVWGGGDHSSSKVCFSQKVTNPVMLVSSLGSREGNNPVSLNFSSLYIVLYDGGGMTYDSNTKLTGLEGYAIILFPGEFDCIDITSNNDEYYSSVSWGLHTVTNPVDIDNPSSSCGVATLRAVGGNGIAYKWYGGGEPANAVTNNVYASGFYAVAVTGANGCTNYFGRGFTVPPSTGPIASISGNPIDCNSVTLTASPGQSYRWNGGTSPTERQNTFTTSGKYFVVITQADGCVSYAEQEVTINPPIVLIAGSTTGCSSVILTASGGEIYVWDGGETPNSATNTFMASGIYHITVTNAIGCTSTIPVSITINQPVVPTVSTSADMQFPICAGTLITFTATGTNEGGQPLYEWINNETKVGEGKTYRTTTLNDGDNITCRLTPAELCVLPAQASSNPITALVVPAPTITFDQSLILSDEVGLQLSPIVTGDVASYQWSPAAGLSDLTISAPLANPDFTTTYTLTVTSTNGCVATAEATVVTSRELTIRNTFTPNGDGINDLWNVKHLTDYPTARVNIYNRLGAPVYQSIGYAKPWDGTYKSQPLPAGVYYYIIDTRKKGASPHTGYITLLR